ncbi:MAG TPA: alpha/beta hydrolase [Rhizomicrobium sp.]|nr:alpha/beta hydrolase [Rhizomicrobium sp.]
MPEKYLHIPKEITFPSKDGLSIRADFYEAKRQKDFLVLCHRSHFNRGEYKDISQRLAAEGFSCLAIDQRSGMNVLGYINETSTLAKKKKLPTGYSDAKQDIEAAVDYAFKKNHSKPVILVGSSYSASLSLLIAKGSGKVKMVAVFSLGEYLKGTDLSKTIKDFSKPIFATSAKKEIADMKRLFRYVGKNHISYFLPKVDGFHGAKSLWPTSAGNEKYWESLLGFLKAQRLPASLTKNRHAAEINGPALRGD